MIRFLVVFIIIAVLAIKLFSKKPNPLLQIPAEWRNVSHPPEMQKAIDLRQKILQLVLKSNEDSGTDLIQHVDNLIAPLAKTLALKDILSEVAKPTGGEVLKSYERSAKNIEENANLVITHLEKALAGIVALAGAELVLHLEPIQEEFQEQQKILQAKLKSTQELSQYLNKHR